MSLDEVATLTALGTAVRAVVLASYRVDSCVVTTAVLCDLCRAFGMTAEPVQVRALVANTAFVTQVETHGWPDGKATTRAWERERGGYVVGIGFNQETSPDRLNGHLLAIVDGCLLVDASLDQADRPEHHILAGGPIVTPAPASFRQGREPLLAHLTEGLVAYKRHEDQQAFLVAPDWTNTQRRRLLVRAAKSRYEQARSA